MAGSRGRPKLYQDEYAEQAKKLCLLGATDRDMADFFGVCEKTINTWKLEYPEFLQSIRAGKLQADAEVAEKLWHRARGYSHPAVKIFMPAGAQSPVYADYTEHYPPDTNAASLWLRNRAPDLWRDVKENKIDGNVKIVPVVNVTINGDDQSLPAPETGDSPTVSRH